MVPSNQVIIHIHILAVNVNIPRVHNMKLTVEDKDILIEEDSGVIIRCKTTTVKGEGSIYSRKIGDELLKILEQWGSIWATNNGCLPATTVVGLKPEDPIRIAALKKALGIVNSSYIN